MWVGSRLTYVHNKSYDLRRRNASFDIASRAFGSLEDFSVSESIELVPVVEAEEWVVGILLRIPLE